MTEKQAMDTRRLIQLRCWPVVVKELLGHPSLSTIQPYADHLEQSDLGRWAFSPA